MILETGWQGLALRALIVVPIAILALRSDITKLRAWRERLRQWRAKGTTPPPEYQRDNNFWRWRLTALAICIGAFIAMIALTSGISLISVALLVALRRGNDGCGCLGRIGPICSLSAFAEPPNKRLKLAGALVLKETVMSCPGGHRRTFNSLAPAGRSPAA